MQATQNEKADSKESDKHVEPTSISFGIFDNRDKALDNSIRI